MTLLRSQEMRVLPGKRQKWGENARKLREIVGKHEVDLRFFQAIAGAVGGTVVTGSLVDDWAAFASRVTAINADKKFQALMQSVNNADPLTESGEVALYEDINEQTGGAPTQTENASVYQVLRLRVLPGRQPQAIEFLSQIREAGKGAGRVVPSVWQSAVGEARILMVITAFENLAALAATRDQGPVPGMQDIVRKAQEDSRFPYVVQVDTRIVSDITDEL